MCAKQLIRALEEARGNGTSMISLIIPPRDQACALKSEALSLLCCH